MDVPHLTLAEISQISDYPWTAFREEGYRRAPRKAISREDVLPTLYCSKEGYHHTCLFLARLLLIRGSPPGQLEVISESQLGLMVSKAINVTGAHHIFMIDT